MSATCLAKLSRRAFVRSSALGVAALPIVVACAPTAAPTPAPAAPTPAPAAPTKPAAAAPTAPEPTKPAAAAPTVAPASKPAERVEISLTVPANPPDGPRYYNEVLLPTWEKAFPNVKLNINMGPFGEFATKLQASIAGGTVTDMFNQDDILIPGYAARGVLRELTDYLKGDAAAFSDVYGLKNGRDPRGKQWGIPKNVYTTGLLYNQNLFDKAGVKYPDDTWTWQTFLDAARKLTTDKAGKHPGDAGFDPKQVEVHGYWVRNYITAEWIPWVYQNGSSLLDQTRTKSNFDNPATIEAFEFTIGLIHKEHVSPPVDEIASMGAQFHVAFLSGKVAMMNHLLGQEGAWAVELRDKFKFDAAMHPQQKARGSADLTHQGVITTNAKNPDVCWQFLKWAATTPAVAIPVYTLQNYGLPVIKSTWTSKEVTEGKRIIPNTKAFTDALDKGYGRDLEPNAVWNEWVTAAARGLDPAYEGKLPVKDALANVHKDVQAILGRFYY